MKTPGINRLDRHGFSVTEMLVVISIMLILLGIGISALQNQGSNFDVFSTLRSCAALFEDARESAMKFSSEMKILVHNDATQPESFGQVIQVVRRVPPEVSGEEESWVAYQNPYLLSRGIFYSPELSAGSDDALAPEPFNFEGSSWLAYSVSRRGYFKNYGALFVVVPGSRSSGGEIIGSEKQRGGFMIQKRGRPVMLSITQLLSGDE